jgi:hypothetical protein
MTIRLPADAAAYLAAEARENFTSRNAQVVAAIRAAMKAKGSAGAPTPPSPDHHQSPSKENADELATE